MRLTDEFDILVNSTNDLSVGKLPVQDLAGESGRKKCGGRESERVLASSSSRLREIGEQLRLVTSTDYVLLRPMLRYCSQ